jgi:hypothetical protein
MKTTILLEMSTPLLGKGRKMTTEQALGSLIAEVETILKTPLPPQRQQFFEGAQHYLRALQQMTERPVAAKRGPRKKKSVSDAMGNNEHEV